MLDVKNSNTDKQEQVAGDWKQKKHKEIKVD
jgi:hypothetical protein